MPTIEGARCLWSLDRKLSWQRRHRINRGARFMSIKKSGIDQSLIRDLAAILNETNLSEIEVEQEDLRIRV